MEETQKTIYNLKLHEAMLFGEGIINDFEAGISTKDETMELFGEYTGRIMSVFYENCKQKVKENPNFFNEPKI